LGRQNVETHRSHARDLSVHRFAPEAQVVQTAPLLGEGKDRRSRIGRLDQLDPQRSRLGNRGDVNLLPRVGDDLGVCRYPKTVPPSLLVLTGARERHWGTLGE